MADLKKLGRKELLELLLQQTKKSESLEEELKTAKAALADRTLRMEKVGSIAEAALQVNGVYEAAQRAADEYMNSVRERYVNMEAETQAAEEASAQKIAAQEADSELRCKDMIAEAQAKAEQTTAEADAKAKQTIEDADAYAAKTTEEADAKAKQTIEDADAYAAKTTEDADARAEQIVTEAKQKADDYWAEVKGKLEAYYSAHAGLRDMLKILGD